MLPLAAETRPLHSLWNSLPGLSPACTRRIKPTTSANGLKGSKH